MQRVAGDIRRLAPDAIVVISPHAQVQTAAPGVIVADRYVGGFDDFGAPSLGFSISADLPLLDAVVTEGSTRGVSVSILGDAGEVHYLDHGATVPLHFFLQAGVRCSMILLSPPASGVSAHRALGRAISAASDSTGQRVALVASGDLSHRLMPGAPAGFSLRGAEFDRHIVSALERNDRDAILKTDPRLLDEAGQCGYGSLVAALAAMENVPAEVLSYEGPFGVGYLVARFQTRADSVGTDHSRAEATHSSLRSEAEIRALQLARAAVESYVRYGTYPEVAAENEGLLSQRAGVFVCIKVDGDLRGCVGTVGASEESLAAEIVHAAVAAAAHDPRFPEIEACELSRLRFSIDILSPLEPVADLEQLDPKRYGVLVEAGSRRGLLLPDLDGVDCVETQLSIARAKGEIPPGERVLISRFTVRRLEEPCM